MEKNLLIDEKIKLKNLLDLFDINDNNMFDKIINREVINNNKDFINTLKIDNIKKLFSILKNFLKNFYLGLKTITSDKKYKLVKLTNIIIDKKHFITLRKLYGNRIKINSKNNKVQKYNGYRFLT